MIGNSYEHYWQDILSEEFRAPSDPMSDRWSRTLGRAVVSAKENGNEVKKDYFSEFTQRLEWAPVVCRVPVMPFDDFSRNVTFITGDEITSTEETLKFYSVRFSQSSAVNRIAIRASMGNCAGTIYEEATYEVGDFLSVQYTRHELHNRFTLPFFNQFTGWTRQKNGLWVPPSLEADQPADAS